MNLTRTLCDFLAGMTLERIGEEDLYDIRYKLLDWLGCCIAAQGKPAQQKAAALLERQGGNPLSSAVGIGDMTGAHEAAFYNGMISHLLEYDDTNKIAITHPGAPVIAAALACAEAEGADFGRFACGVASGYEAMIRLGGAVNPNHYEYWHTTGTCGTFAAAAAAARIMELDGEGTERAFGIAATMASGLVGVFGTEAKLVTVGNAARNGIIAAELARAGFSAPEDGFAGEKGYARAANAKEDLSFMIPAPGDRLMLEDAYYKMHASCGHTHSALDALQALIAEEHVRSGDVDRAEIEVYRTAEKLCGKFTVETEARAKFSLPYCAASMLCRGRVTLSEFDESALSDPVIADLAGRISVKENPAFTAAYPALRSEKVTLWLKDGRTLSRRVDLPVGRPPYAFIDEKFNALACMAVDKGLAGEIRQAALGLSPGDGFAPLGNLIRNLK
ncbi:MAG: MmgE/PrpD family protein [Clostridia bacterium]|nr:MmgE/PrpD family protein [Clostridia bacterium]